MGRFSGQVKNRDGQNKPDDDVQGLVGRPDIEQLYDGHDVSKIINQNDYIVNMIRARSDLFFQLIKIMDFYINQPGFTPASSGLFF
ncbi:hypothetical protein JCM14469_32170 [Desulfatiferula olefinivorans]